MAEGAVSFVVDQLSVWLTNERHLLKGLEQGVQHIQNEMRHIKAFLKIADSKEDSDPILKDWVKQLREISYDVEDILDKYMCRFGRLRAPHGFSGHLKKSYATVKNLKARRQIASKIEDIRNRLDSVSQVHQRYQEMHASMDPGSTSSIPNRGGQYDGRNEAMFLDEDQVVGIEQPKKKLLEWIHSKDVGLEVISVVGMGGLGKTTVVKKVYDDESVESNFDTWAWVVASKNEDARHTLKVLIQKLVGQVRQSPPERLEDMSADDMGEWVHDFLKEKKYMIVVDNLWNKNTWAAIEFALPRRGPHCCIIITTRSNCIANAACRDTNHVYVLQPLEKDKSTELFYKQAFPMTGYPPDNVKLFAENIIERCEGLPLAIVVMAGVLATKNNRFEEWEKFNRTISNELGEGGSLERLWKVLLLGFNDLPFYLKSCFMYLCIFPRDAVMCRREIIELWTAERLVVRVQNKTIEEEADEYINELVNRNLMQVAGGKHSDRGRMVVVHGLVGDFITSKSEEHNLVTVCNREGEGTVCPDKIRRLAIHEFINFSVETNNLSYLRSLVMLCGDCDQVRELICQSKILKVLYLKGASLEDIPEEIFKLYSLRHMCIWDTAVQTIPRSIKYLENMETLCLPNSDVTELPNEILKLQKLRHIIVFKVKTDNSFPSKRGIRAPSKMADSMLDLQTVWCINADNGVREIGKMKELRMLGILMVRSEDGVDLCSSLSQLYNLRQLTISSNEEGEMLDLDYSIDHGLQFLTTLKLEGRLERIPRWIQSLSCLSTLYLCWSKLGEDPLESLQNLSRLTLLKIHGAYVGELCFKARGFPVLKELRLEELTSLTSITVEEGSMPLLELWFICDCELLMVAEGIPNLTNLKKMSFHNAPKMDHWLSIPGDMYGLRSTAGSISIRHDVAPSAEQELAEMTFQLPF